MMPLKSEIVALSCPISWLILSTLKAQTKEKLVHPNHKNQLPTLPIPHSLPHSPTYPQNFTNIS